MLTTFFKKTVIFTLLAMALLSVSSALAEQKLSVRADNYYPFNGDPAAEKPGYIIDILKAIYSKAGMSIDYQVSPWKRAVADGEAGSINAILCAFKTDAPEFVYPEEPVAKTGYTFFVKKDSTWKYETVDSLKGKIVGVVGGYTYAEALDAYVKANEKDAAKVAVASGDAGAELNIKKLAAGRIDTYPEVPEVFFSIVDQLGLKRDDFKVAGVAAEPEFAYVAFSPKKDDSKKLAQMFTDGIRELRKSGELAKILARYNLSDWAK